MSKLAEYWPLANLVVRTPKIELRWPSDSDLVELADLARRGVHDPDEMPFVHPWTRASDDEVTLDVLQWHWRARGEWVPDRWSWNPVVVLDGQIVGTQGLTAHCFAVRRTVTTGSWLGRNYQGRGIGTEMRAAVLYFAFAGLGAVRAETGAWEDNGPSLAVTHKLGYQANGDLIHVSEGRFRRQLVFALERERWERRRRDDIQIEGLTGCLSLFDASQSQASASTGR